MPAIGSRFDPSLESNVAKAAPKCRSDPGSCGSTFPGSHARWAGSDLAGYSFTSVAYSAPQRGARSVAHARMEVAAEEEVNEPQLQAAATSVTVEDGNTIQPAATSATEEDGNTIQPQVAATCATAATGATEENGNTI